MRSIATTLTNRLAKVRHFEFLRESRCGTPYSYGKFIYDELDLFRSPKRRLMDWCHERRRVFLEASSLALIFNRTSENVREVVGWYGANDTMLRRSAQLLLTPENDHFEGSMQLEEIPSVIIQCYHSMGGGLFL